MKKILEGAVSLGVLVGALGAYTAFLVKVWA